MTRLVGVHGVGNHRPALTSAEATAQLSKLWTRHLLGRPPTPADNVDLQVAYYAPHLQTQERQGAPNDDPADLDPAAQAMVLSWVAQLGAPYEIAQGYGTLPIRQAVSWVADRFGLDFRLVAWFVNRFFGELSTYLSDDQRRVAARRAVADLIGAHAPRVVLAHSLGSVLAYEALWDNPSLKVDLLVTLGSPLGMPEVVFERLDPAPAGAYGARPPRVARWINLADPGDLIAIPRRLARRFHHIDLDDERAIAAFDFHRVANYLSCSATRAHLAPYLE